MFLNDCQNHSLKKTNQLKVGVLCSVYSLAVSFGFKAGSKNCHDTWRPGRMPCSGDMQKQKHLSVAASIGSSKPESSMEDGSGRACSLKQARKISKARTKNWTDWLRYVSHVYRIGRTQTRNEGRSKGNKFHFIDFKTFRLLPWQPT